MATSPVQSKAEFLARDQAHLIHPLHDPAAHQKGHVWARGEGARRGADGADARAALFQRTLVPPNNTGTGSRQHTGVHSNQAPPRSTV